MKYFNNRVISEYKYLFLIAAANFLLVYLSSFVKAYGYFIDEFYYIACAFKPAFGYVDHPPLAPLILTVFIENAFNYPTLAETYKIAALNIWNHIR